ncbi:MAG: acyl-CoA thioesterase [bacterium]
MEDYSYRIDFSVRDYECDIQGIVNNAVYQNYLEHARHEYLKSLGINFNEFAQKGINLVVLRVEIDYKYPLRSGDRFFIGVKMERISRIKFAFNQGIYRLPDNHQIIKGKVIGTALNTKGRPKIPEEIEKLFIKL